MAGGPINQSIIFSLGLVGASQFKAGALMAVGAMTAMAVGASKLVNSADLLMNSWNALSETQRQAVAKMDAATKGMIDTHQEFKSALALSEAGIKTNGDSLAKLGVLAADHAKKMGMGPDGATEVMKMFTESVTKGSDRAAKALGIDLMSAMRDAGLKTDDLGAKQAMLLKLLEERAAGLSVEITTLAEQQYVLNNNFETFVGLMVGGKGSAIGVLGDFNDELASLNATMMDSQDGFADATMSIEGMGYALSGAMFDMFGMAEAASAMDRKLGQLINSASDLKKLTGELAAEKEKGQFIENANKAIEAGDIVMATYWSARAQGYEVTNPNAAPAEPAPKKRKGGGGGKAKPEVTDAELQQEMDLVMLLGIGDAEEQGVTAALIDEEGRLWANADQMLDAKYAALEHQAYIEEQFEIGRQELEQFGAQSTEGMWEEELEQAQQRMDLERQHAEWLDARRDIELEYAESWRSSWENALEGQRAGAIAAGAAMNALNGVVYASIRAAIMGEKSFGKMIAAIVRDAAISGAAQSTVLGLLELVKAATYYAMPFGTGVAQGAIHTAAAGYAFAQAAIMMGIAAGMHAASGGYSGGGGGGAKGGAGFSGGGGGGYTSAPAQGATEEQPIVFQVNGDIGGLFEHLEIVRVNRKRTGVDTNE